MTALVIIVMIPIALKLFITANTRAVKRCYRSDRETFDQIAEDFKNAYKPGVVSANFYEQNSKIELSFADNENRDEKENFVKAPRVEKNLKKLKKNIRRTATAPCFLTHQQNTMKTVICISSFR